MKKKACLDYAKGRLGKCPHNKREAPRPRTPLLRKAI